MHLIVHPSYFSISSTKVECGGCCLANIYCIAFRWVAETKVCEEAYTTLTEVTHGPNAAETPIAKGVEVYRDETLLENMCFKQGFSL